MEKTTTFKLPIPHKVRLKDIPLGYSMTSMRDGEYGWVMEKGFTSTDQADTFLNFMEGWPSDILNLIPGGIQCSSVDSLLAVIKKDKSADVYINEKVYSIAGRVKKAVKEGDRIYASDLLDIEKFSVTGVEIPADTGIIFVFSFGWRKGFFFDFGPLHSNKRVYDLNVELAEHCTYLMFQHLFSLTDDQWNTLITQQWFPFIYLSHSLQQQITKYLRGGLPIDDLLNPIAEELKGNIVLYVDSLDEIPLLKDDLPVFRQAIDRYLVDDHISASHIIYPRLEGIMRRFHYSVSEDHVSQSKLVDTVIKTGGRSLNPKSLLLASRFDTYLRKSYFADFDPKNPRIVSRHSIGHGTAPVDLLNLKATTVGILTFLQVAAYLPPTKKQEPKDAAQA